jgi:hypothetical protein
MSPSRLTLLVLFIFCCGVGPTLGEKPRASKFDRYQVPIQVQQIDWLVLQANIQVVREWVDGKYELIETPVLSFNPKLKRIEAIASVNADELNGLPAEEVKKRLYWAALETHVSVKRFLEEFDGLQGEDFYMQFRGISFKAAKLAGPQGQLPISTFAEFSHGELILH